MPIKIILVAGARPNFMKVAPLGTHLTHYSEFQPVFVHTGQHYDREMSDCFFQDLGIPRPDIYLGVGSGSHAQQTAKIMMAFEAVLMEQQPDLMVVVGDVNSTVACALVAAKMLYPDGRRPRIAHVEAGLRSFDRTMPEEINRIVTDALSDFLFTTSRDAVENLRREGIDHKKIFFVGNVMIDTLLAHRVKAEFSLILDQLGLRDGGPNKTKDYAVCTLHRPSNVDDVETFQEILEALIVVGRQLPIIYPTHPRTRQRLESGGLASLVNFSDSKKPVNLTNPITCIEPLGYLDFVKLMANTRLVLTDSGGIQEETSVLGVPCVTIRENTERPITISEGTNTLAGIKKEGIIKACVQALRISKGARGLPEKWDGKAAERIVRILLTGKLDD